MSSSTQKLSALVNRVLDALDDPKTQERITALVIGYGCCALAALTVLAIILELLIHQRFAYWHFATAFFFWVLGRVSMPARPKEYTAPEIEIKTVKTVKTPAPSVSIIPTVQPLNV